MSDNERYVGFVNMSICAAVGIVAGICIGAAVRGNKDDVLEHFSREGDAPAIIRAHRSHAKDAIYVVPSVGSFALTNQYISLDTYLDTIENPYDRTIAEAKIKKRVNW